MMGLRGDIDLLVKGKKMTNYEANMANAVHAIWDVIVMHHSIESAADTHGVSVSALSDVARQVLFKVKECEYYEKRKKSSGV